MASLNKLIIDTLSPLGYPVEPITYTGDKTTYIIFNYADDRGEIFRDDIPVIDIISMQIHLYVPYSTNYLLVKRKIRAKLLKAGFTYPQVTVLSENDTKTNHIIFECDIEQNSESEE